MTPAPLNRNRKRSAPMATRGDTLTVNGEVIGLIVKRLPKIRGGAWRFMVVKPNLDTVLVTVGMNTYSEVPTRAATVWALF